MHAAAIFLPQFSKMLTNLKLWLEEAKETAEGREFDPNNLVASRLAPDMFTLTRQVQSSCDTAKFTAARLSGTEAPSHPDTEATLEELVARIDSVVAYLDGFEATAFDEALDRTLTLNFMGGATAKGSDYLVEFAMPNFYFHLSMAYAILRNSGVKLGKRRFLGHVTLGAPVES
ncbi:MAG: DUF1993 family protein [Myxococcota bacterium]